MTLKCSPRPLQQQHKPEQLQPSCVHMQNWLPNGNKSQTLPLLLPQCPCLSQASQIRCVPSYVHHMWCRSDLASFSWVKHCVSIECVHMLAASLGWRQGPNFVRSPPGAVPQKRTLGLICFKHLSGSKTRGDSNHGIWDMAVPCRIKQTTSQAPVTGNLTQIRKAALIVSDMCILFHQMQCLCFAWITYLCMYLYFCAAHECVLERLSRPKTLTFFCISSMKACRSVQKRDSKLNNQSLGMMTRDGICLPKRAHPWNTGLNV